MPLPGEIDRLSVKTVREQVFDVLSAWVEDGTLTPGEVLKDETIATRLGVSRTPVREALQRLEHYGMVEMQPNRLTRVTDAVPGDVLRVYRPIAALHAVAAVEAMDGITDANIDAMEAANVELVAATQRRDWPAARDADIAFHQVLVDAASNRYLDSALGPLSAHVRRIGTLYFSDVGPALESAQEHREIIAAVVERDGATASRLVERNFLRGMDRQVGQEL